MTAARALAFSAAMCGVLGAWELLGAVQGARVTAWIGAAVAPLRSAAAEGREPSPPERKRLALVAAAALSAAGWVLAGPVAGVTAAVAGPAMSGLMVRVRRRRYERSVRAGAADAARAMAAALAAGRSVRTAVGEAAVDVGGPAGHEMRAAAHALSVGAATEPVLERLRRSAGGGPWDTLVAALLLQRDAGGDLAGLLRGVASSLEEAARAERDAYAATAQSRATAWIVAGLPAAAAALAEIGSPGFLAGLLGNPVSAVLAAVALLLQAAALLAVRRLTR